MQTNKLDINFTHIRLFYNTGKKFIVTEVHYHSSCFSAKMLFSWGGKFLVQ